MKEGWKKSKKNRNEDIFSGSNGVWSLHRTHIHTISSLHELMQSSNIKAKINNSAVLNTHTHTHEQEPTITPVTTVTWTDRVLEEDIHSLQSIRGRTHIHSVIFICKVRTASPYVPNTLIQSYSYRVVKIVAAVYCRKHRSVFSPSHHIRTRSLGIIGWRAKALPLRVLSWHTRSILLWLSLGTKRRWCLDKFRQKMCLS